LTKYGNISRSDGKLYVEIIGEKEEREGRKRRERRTMRQQSDAKEKESG
jgi:hypothetical protein